VDFLSGVAAEGLAQDLRAQQAANVIGTERRAALQARGHVGGLLNIFYSSIDGI
jgi:hypothetical protein